MERGVKACRKPGPGGEARVLVAALGGAWAKAQEADEGLVGGRYPGLVERRSWLSARKRVLAFDAKLGCWLRVEWRQRVPVGRFTLLAVGRIGRRERRLGHRASRRGVVGRLRLVGGKPAHRPTRAGDASNGNPAQACGSTVECGRSSLCEACGGAFADEVRAFAPGTGVSSRVHVTTSRLQKLAGGICLAGRASFGASGSTG